MEYFAVFILCVFVVVVYDVLRIKPGAAHMLGK
jgi:hypothetical protein